MSHLRARMPSQHKHRLPALTIQLLEQYQRLLLQSETALLVAVHNVQRVLAPVGSDIVLAQRDRQHLVAGVVDGDAERLVDLDLRIA